MDNTKRNTERRGSILLLTVTIIIVIIIVVIGICVGVLTEGNTRKIVLFVLLILLILTGIGSCIFVEYQRKQAIKKRDRCAELWLRATLNEQRQAVQPSAPPLSARTSWALTAPWRHGHKSRNYSPGSTLPPYPSPSINSA
ncbi:hypothetical protein RN001_006269 [Aquatica leii]|uniref:Uncharacterized protein n=1 Tax=Aquatica leii TaxID=1421715 RepID=A0AAN7Q8Q2_9COLE|nr:hypothetical protein RN001_006269 [Aquatica leii]